MPRHTPEQREEALKLLGQGYGPYEVGRRLGVHCSTVQRWREGGGVENRQYPPELKAKALRMLKTTGRRTVANELGIPMKTIRKWAYRAGLPNVDGQGTYVNLLRGPQTRRNGNLHGIFYRAPDVLQMISEAGIDASVTERLPLPEHMRRNIRRMQYGETTYVSESTAEKILSELGLVTSMFDTRPVYMHWDNRKGGSTERPMPEDWRDREWSRGYDKAMTA